MGNLMKLRFDNALIYNIEDINSSFAKGSLKVMYVGANRNGSYISKDTVQAALPSLYNVPIVCHWDYESGEIGSHDVELVQDDRGLRLRNLTEPCGVVPEHATFSFQVDIDEDGNEHEYLVIDGVILWKRQDVYLHIMDDLGGRVDHSMEITVTESAHDDATGLFVIKAFEFTALCLLEAAEPCFQGSELELFSVDHFKQKTAEMMAELREMYAKINPSPEKVDINNKKNYTEGGEVLEEKISLAAEYGITIDDLDFAVDDFSMEELREKFAEIKEENERKAFELAGQLMEEIRSALAEETVEREWGPMPRYWFVDYDPDKGEVYAHDEADWYLYGFAYSMNGDHVVIDFDSKKRMKFAIVEFDEGEQASPFGAAFEMIAEKYRQNDTDWNSKFSEASEKIEQMTASINEMTESLSELESLREYKLNTEAAIADAQRADVLSKFTELVGIEEFDQLSGNCSEFTAEELEEKCFAIRGRNIQQLKFSVEPKVSKIKIDKVRPADNDPEPYGDLFVKYGRDK